uniref:F-box domain-containing protein n=1 Tax=Oryza brachyantha TaxID=4533 RepID=J3MIR1_ORYBR
MAKRKMTTSRRQQIHEATAAKRKKLGLRLNDLPMDILESFLSRLPIKDAVRTKALSCLWKHTSLCHKNLLFSSRTMMSQRSYTAYGTKSITAEEFVTRVNAVLQQHRGGGVEKFEVYFELENEYAEQIESWINFVISSRTKQLILDFSPTRSIKAPYSFPFRLFDATNGSHLQFLEVCSVSLKPPADFKGLVNLKRLHLVVVDITDEHIHLLLSNCNVLEFLGIYDCDNLTRLRTCHPSNQLKHLVVKKCYYLKEIELNYGLTTLEYGGELIPLSSPGKLLLTNICIDVRDICGAIEYLFTNLPSTLPHLKVLTLKCHEFERYILPDNPLKFIYLRHMRLELIFHGLWEKKTDALDFACLLEAAPLLENLELHMWMNCVHLRYRKNHGVLRSLPPCTHTNLKLVNITGFYGQKDQLELVLHILRNSVSLEVMRIDPKPYIAVGQPMMQPYEEFYFVDGSKVAMKYIRKADHRNIVNVLEVSRKDVENVSARRLIDPI